MARMIIGVVAFLLLASLVSSEVPRHSIIFSCIVATIFTDPAIIPKCCQDFHAWAEEVGCPPPLDGQCNAWCQNRCSGGACKIKGGKHYCHCNCH
uniref:Knottin scorpion toxin-like domain-containing protein n=1 Tax=Leersia perrieri TaxID=77586 RepID=A0A0D9WQL0_9ORYZ